MPGVIADQAPAKARKPTKNEQRRAKKKQQKQVVSVSLPGEAFATTHDTQTSETPDVVEDTAKVEPDANKPPKAVEPATEDPVQDVPDIDDFGADEDPLLQQFASVFAKFREQETDGTVKEDEKPEVFYDDDDNIQGEDEEAETQKRLSKKARKAASKLTIAELKAVVRKPELVEWTDTSASDPQLLVSIKSARNVVPVPDHWSLKREYLSSKRGIEKPLFALPKFIAETGISEMRDAVLEKQADASLKQQQRARVQPKMGKLDIDYQKLYEAFFRRQTKPTLTGYGDTYREGKEYETNLRHLKPGNLSEELQEALNIGPGAPPPWLLAQQKHGPPPSYPALRIPGLNAPPPPGAQWGFHPGGYGKPPLDEENHPLWGGDVFGMGDPMYQQKKDEIAVEPVDRTLWGELQPFADDEEEEEEEEESEEEGDGDDEGRPDAGGLETPFGGMETPSGVQSTVPTDFMGTRSMAEEFDLRKQRRGTETEESHHGGPRQAGRVLNERSIRAEGFFGGQHAYDLNNSNAPPPNVSRLEDRESSGGRKRKMGDMDVSVDVDALERDDRLSKEEVRRQYDASRSQQGGAWQGGGGMMVDQEDLSQMIAEESAKRQKRDQERERRRDGDRGGGRRR
jgi:splicing factor 3B subunit 2